MKILFLLTTLYCLQAQDFRPPAVPLIVNDPYQSIWSMADKLTDVWSKHWAGGNSALYGQILIDGECFRYMGPIQDYCPNAMNQKSVEVKATTTTYIFEESGVQLTVKFRTPAILKQVELLSLPVTYILFDLENTDQKNHDVKLYYDNSAEQVVNENSEEVQWSQTQSSSLNVQKIGSKAQVFNGAQNADRLNWGYWYTFSFINETTQTTISSNDKCRQSFPQRKNLPEFDTNMPRPANKDWPVTAVRFDFGSLKPNEQKSDMILIAYDHIYGIEYFGTKLKPFWTQLYNDVKEMAEAVIEQNFYNNLMKQCDDLDNSVSEALFNTAKGQNTNYRDIGNLAYRQTTGGLMVVWNHVINETWIFMKEISSDGDVSTIDVIYPASPLIMYENPEIQKMLHLPLLSYANNETKQYGLEVNYNLAWAPHHLGVWPICDLIPSKQEQMPVEETANILILTSFIAQYDNDVKYLEKYWKLLKIWGDYLVSSLPDPGNQLCTDDFMGPSPHNINLSGKGILGLGAYSQILDLIENQEASKYMNIAKNYSNTWIKQGLDNDTTILPHYKLQYDKPNSWSQKYNLVWQPILDLDIFPQEVFDVECKFYESILNDYGLALDVRTNFTKVDSSLWIATFCNDVQFQKIVDRERRYANETPDRVPFSDWYWSTTSKRQGFQARPVVGGVFSRVLLDKVKLKKQKISQNTVQLF